jgi:pyrimidine 5'-nucleotidase
LKYVHDIPIDQYLKPDPELRRILLNLSQTKWIFTNSDKAHSKRVLTALNILDLFEGILDIETFNFMNKPNPQIYIRALELIGNPPPNECIYVDDSAINLAPAKKMGITTVLLGENSFYNSADYSIIKIQDITKIPGILLQ